MAAFQVVSYSDPSGRYGQYLEQVKALVALAGTRITAALLSSSGTVDVAISIDASASGRTIASAGPGSGLLGRDGLVEFPAASKLIGGTDTNGSRADIQLSLTPLFFDTSESYLGTANAVPAYRFDALTVLQHELTHGIVFNGFLDAGGSSSSGYRTVYDTFVQWANGKPYFSGAVTQLVYGSALPLTPSGSGSAIYHVDTSAGGVLARDLMGPTATDGLRVDYSAVDLAMMRDMGLPVLTTFTSADGHTVAPGTGARSVAGTAGIDTLVLAGTHGAFAVAARTDGSFTVGNGRDAYAVSGFERLQFADAHVVLPSDAGASQVMRLYEAAFARAADAGGLGYFMHALDQGAALQTVAQGFVDSREFSAAYAQPGSQAFLTQLYGNVFHRAPDAGGLAYFTHRLDAGIDTRASVLVAFSESVEGRTMLAGVASTGTEYTPF
jgi:hypothetical protein